MKDAVSGEQNVRGFLPKCALALASEPLGAKPEKERKKKELSLSLSLSLQDINKKY